MICCASQVPRARGSPRRRAWHWADRYRVSRARLPRADQQGRPPQLPEVRPTQNVAELLGLGMSAQAPLTPLWQPGSNNQNVFYERLRGHTRVWLQLHMGTYLRLA